MARAAIDELAGLHAFISLSAERFDGVPKFGESDGPGGSKRVRGEAGPIVAVKDLIDVSGLPTTGGSLDRSGSPAGSDAAVVARVREAGGIVIGKTNLYEWAFGVTGHNPHYGDVVNPRDRQRTAGGSSGGSAVAVATGMCDWAIGTDTGGSIRIPAALCGVVGFKPTRGLLSTEGVLPLSATLDTVGPLARDVQTVTKALEILSGQSLALVERLRPRLAIPRGWVDEQRLDPAVRAVWRELARGLPAIDFPELRRMSTAARIVLNWEAAALHESALRRAPERYGWEVRERLEQVWSEKDDGSDAAYRGALVEMPELSAQVESALEGWDGVLLPGTACVAPLLSERDVREPLIRFTRPFNLTGHPAMVIPAPSLGLPVGAQLIGQLGAEARLASVALALERSWR